MLQNKASFNPIKTVLFASTINSIYFPVYQNQTGIVFVEEEYDQEDLFFSSLAKNSAQA